MGKWRTCANEMQPAHRTELKAAVGAALGDGGLYPARLAMGGGAGYGTGLYALRVGPGRCTRRGAWAAPTRRPHSAVCRWRLRAKSCDFAASEGAAGRALARTEPEASPRRSGCSSSSVGGSGAPPSPLYARLSRPRASSRPRCAVWRRNRGLRAGAPAAPNRPARSNPAA